MPIHFWNLLSRAFEAVPTALGSNWLGLLFPMWGFLLTLLVILLTGGVGAMKSHLRQNLVRGFAVAGAAWASLFLWCIITTVYTDHMDLSGRTRELHNELGESARKTHDAVEAATSPLLNQLSNAKQNCAKTAGENEALERQTSTQQDTINNCQTQALKLLVPEAFKITPVTLEGPHPGVDAQNWKVLLITNKPISPIDLVVTCDRRIDGISGDVLGGGGVELAGGTNKLMPNAYELHITSPAWTVITPLELNVSYSGGENISCHFDER